MPLRGGFDDLRDTDWFYAGPFRWCVSSALMWSYSHFCHNTPSITPHNCPSLSLALSLVYNYGFAGFYPLAICHFRFFSPHLLVFLLLPAMCSHLWLSIPHCSPLCSPLLVALCRCRIRPNNMTHKEGLNSLWFASRYQTLLYAVCRTLNGRWEHKMLTY